MTEFSCRITGVSGLHARPAGLLVQCTRSFASDILISCKGRHVNGKELFAVMSLAAQAGDVLFFAADGPDERDAADAVQRILRQQWETG